MTPKLNKYQMVDNLFEDPVISMQKYYLVSYLSPELVKNCKIRAIKVKGYYSNYEDAMVAKEEFEKIDPVHKIFIGDVGKWAVTDRESEFILNELAGRRKEYLENSKKTHKDRVKQSIKCGIEGKESDDIDNSTDSKIIDTTIVNSEQHKNDNSSNKSHTSSVLGPKENDFFELQDDTESSKPESNDTLPSNKTYVDKLTNDKPIDGQEWSLYSFLSPEGLMNTNVRSSKARGGFKTKEDANKRAEFLRKIDKDYDIFVGETGHWMEQDPDPLSVENGVYKNKKENKIMEKLHKKSYENKINGEKDDDAGHAF